MVDNLITFIEPNAGYLDGYLEAINEGNYINMDLGFADWPEKKILQDKKAYLSTANYIGPSIINLKDGTKATIKHHKLYWIIDGKKFLGSLAIRYDGDKEVLEKYCGHVGMAIRPRLLNKGYGVKAARKAWLFLKEKFTDKNMNSIFMTCNKTNKVSERLITYMGGAFYAKHDDVFGEGPNTVFRIML